MFFEDKLIFFPEAYPVGDWQPTLPVGMSCDDIYFESEGRKLHGWLIEPQHRFYDGVVLHCHGNAGNITTRFAKSCAIAALGLPVFVFDYRSYGRSEAGRLSEKAIYTDAEAAWKFLIEQKYREAQIVVQGVSLGGGPAGYLAEKFSPAGLILESTFTSMPDMSKKVYPFIPRSLVKTQFNTAKRIRSLELDKVVIHGSEDEVVPYEMGQELFELAPEPKEFVEIKNALHTNLLEKDREAYLSAFRNLFDRVLQEISVLN